MTQGGMGFSEDAVAAKLSLELPNDSERILKDIAEYSGRIQVNMEAMSRYTGEYINYLKSFPDIQVRVNELQREQLQVLRDTKNAMDGIRAAQGSGFVQAGMGGQQQQYVNDAGRIIPAAALIDSGRLPPGYDRFTTPGQRSDNPAERQHANAQEEINRQNRVRDRVTERESERPFRTRQRRDDDDESNGRHAAGGRHRRNEPDAPEEEEIARGNIDRRIRQAGQGVGGGIEDVTRLLAPGGSNSARLASLARLLGRAPNPDDDEDNGSGLGGALRRLPNWAKGVGIAGGVIAGGAAINGAIQNTGEAMQGLRAQDLRTHSLGAGIGIESDIRLMALNPLLTNEQSREIIMGAMKGGYQGKQYDSAVDFVKTNLIDLNMEVGKSFELLKNNVILGGQEMSSVKFDLLQAQSLAKLGPATTEQNQSGYASTSAALINQGMDAETAGDTANFASSVFNTVGPDGAQNPLGMAGADGLSSWHKIVQAAIKNPSITSMAWNQYAPNAQFYDTWNVIGKNTNQAIYGILQKMAKENDLNGFNVLMNSYGITAALDGNKSLVKSLYEQLRNGKVNPLVEADEQQTASTKITVGGKDAVEIPTFEEYKALPGNEGKTQSDYNSSVSGGAIEPLKVDSEMLRNYAKSHPKAIVVDPDGKRYLLDPTDDQQALGIAHGTWKIIDDVLPEDTSRNGDGSLSNGGMFRGEPIDGTNSKLTKGLDSLDLSGKTPVSTAEGFNIPGVASGGSKPETNYQNQPANGGVVDMSNAPGQPPSGGWLDLSPFAKKIFNFVPQPGNVPSDAHTLNSNSGANGTTNNDKPGG